MSLELLMPAGSVTKMNLALDYGADAVYLGPPRFSLRARENHFEDDELKASIESVHQRRKKVYMTLNIFSRNRKIKSFTESVKNYAAMKPDAFIMSDPGLASIAKETCPEIPIHLSVQANCMNWKSVEFWKKSLGIERVILSRELFIQEIAEIKQRVPDIELEAFVHGSICIAYSGRCLMSSYMDRRDANQGVCDNSCRKSFNVFEKKEFYIEDANLKDGELYQIDEDENGTYILNAKDLCMINHLEELIKAGVISFKVEGRTKSEFYAAMVARAYRGALDDCIRGETIQPRWWNDLNKLTNRGYHTAFMFEDPGANGQSYESSTKYHETVHLVGFVEQQVESKTVVENISEPLLSKVVLDVKHKISCGQTVQVITPQSSEFTATIKQIVLPNGAVTQDVHSGIKQVVLQLYSNQVIPKQAMILSDQALIL